MAFAEAPGQVNARLESEDGTDRPLSLADVSNLSVSQLWVKIFSHLHWTEVVRGRSISSVLRRELPRIITHLSVRCFASAAQRRLQIATFAQTFTELRELTLRAPLSISPEPDNQLWNSPNFSFPSLQRLHLEYESCGEPYFINLQERHLPALREFYFTAKEGPGDGLPGSAIQFNVLLPSLERLELVGLRPIPGDGRGWSLSLVLPPPEPLEKVNMPCAVSQVCAALRAAPRLRHVVLRDCMLWAPNLLRDEEGDQGVPRADPPVLLGGDMPSLESVEIKSTTLMLDVHLRAPNLRSLRITDPPPPMSVAEKILRSLRVSLGRTPSRSTEVGSQGHWQQQQQQQATVLLEEVHDHPAFDMQSKLALQQDPGLTFVLESILDMGEI